MERWLPRFLANGFAFNGAWCFDSENNHFLLGKNGCAILLDDTLLEELQSHILSEGLCLKLVQHGLADVEGKLAPPGVNQHATHHCVSQSIPSYFLIDITKQCNFDCAYCFRDFSDSAAIEMTVLSEICRYILDYASENHLKRIGIQLWGGEPLVAMERIGYVVNFFSESPLDVHFDIETNGSLVTEDLARQLKDWNIHVGVSVDGLPRHQNLQRCFIGGASSSRQVENGIECLQKYYGSRLGSITVITKNNCNDLPEIIDYLVNKLKFISVKFNVIRENTKTKSGALGLSLDEVRNFADALCDIAEAYGILGLTFPESNIQQKRENLLSRSKANMCLSRGCQGGRGIISFSRDGGIYPCEMTDVRNVCIGSIYSDATLSEQLSAFVIGNPIFVEKSYEPCARCPWQYYCRGGCTSRIIYGGKNENVDYIECEINRVIYPRIVNNILRQAIM